MQNLSCMVSFYNTGGSDAIIILAILHAYDRIDISNAIVQGVEKILTYIYIFILHSFRHAAFTEVSY